MIKKLLVLLAFACTTNALHYEDWWCKYIGGCGSKNNQWGGPDVSRRAEDEEAHQRWRSLFDRRNWDASRRTEEELPTLYGDYGHGPMHGEVNYGYDFNRRPGNVNHLMRRAEALNGGNGLGLGINIEASRRAEALNGGNDLGLGINIEAMRRAEALNAGNGLDLGINIEAMRRAEALNGGNGLGLGINIEAMRRAEAPGYNTNVNLKDSWAGLSSEASRRAELGTLVNVKDSWAGLSSEASRRAELGTLVNINENSWGLSSEASRRAEALNLPGKENQYTAARGYYGRREEAEDVARRLGYFNREDLPKLTGSLMRRQEEAELPPIITFNGVQPDKLLELEHSGSLMRREEEAELPIATRRQEE